MALNISSNIVASEKGRELVQHGSALFPIACYAEDLSSYSVAWHWHEEFEYVLCTKGPLHVDVNIVSNDVLDTEAFKAWRPEYATAEFILEDGKYICGWAVEKMSKSMFNVVNPDMIVEKYGADTLRMYEMFLGPVEQSKPWDTNGIDGVHRFIRKFWSLFYDLSLIHI